MFSRFIQPEGRSDEELRALIAAGFYPLIAGGAEGEEGGGDAAEGQGDGEGEQSGLYDLDSVPEHLREHLAPHLKEIEGNATRKFQENADYRKQWEPYEQLGVNEIDPGALEQLISFANMASDPEQFKAWVQEAATELGVLGEDTGSEGGDDDWLNEDGALEGLTPDQVKEIIAEQLTDQLEPLKQQMAQQQQEQVEQQKYEEISGQLDEIRAEHGEDIDTDAILKFAYAYADTEEDPIAKGLEDYLSLVGKGQSELFEQKRSQPRSPEGPGAAGTKPSKITTFEEAKPAALERLKASRSA